MEQLKEKLAQFNRKTISYDELQMLAPNHQTYEQFAAQIKKLENENILQMIKSTGRNNRTPSLAYRYRIRKQLLNETYYKELQRYRMKFHNAINLDNYFKLNKKVWEEDLPYLKMINDYIERKGFPSRRVPAPERSFELVGDEKWIEQTGEQLLYRINLWEKLNIMPVADPLMFALNPSKINECVNYHLIVENKTTYQALLPVLHLSTFTSLIYGAGKKIEKGIENFDTQLPIKSKHQLFYFGDIDREGINIWYRLNQKRQVNIAVPFYKMCLKKEAAIGKTNQSKDKLALQTFFSQFEDQDATTIKQLLDKGAYFPQEVLKTDELQQILLTTTWEA